MPLRSPFLHALILMACPPPSATIRAAEAEGEARFALEVRPILASKCFACHGAETGEIKGGLDLTSLAGMLEGGDILGPAVEPGDAQASPLYLAVSRTEPGLEMPPKQSDALTEEQVWSIRDWINAGAPWPDDARIAAIVAEQAQGVLVPTSGGLSDDWTDRRYAPEDLWAYRPIRRPEIPLTRNGSTPVDAFIDHRLDAVGLEPAPRADRHALIRRASFDLIGLPPSPKQIEEFLGDPRPDRDAFSGLVDQLLASPHYGERWGRHWLDVVRYADTAGFANDYERPNAWRYRDYVVRSFNEDKPFDRFIREQIAGDELAPDDPEHLVAVGLLRMGAWEQTAMSVAKVTRQQFLDDVTDLVGQAFLAHPLQCARCHDHKFDPIPTRDYYSIQAVFATTQFADREAPFLPDENSRSGLDGRRDLEERIARYEAIVEDIRDKEEAAARSWYADRGLDYAPRTEKFKARIPEDQVVPKGYGLTAEDLGLERIARKSLERHRWELDRDRPIALSVYNGATRPLRSVNGPIDLPDDPIKGGTIERTAILSGGDVFSPAEPVAPGILSCVPRLDDPGATGANTEIPDSVAGRRLAFAGWLASPENPLTPRVMVNRIWQGHFGRGLVATSNNFGTKGDKPTHPELLDWLSSEFVASGWSIKAMHRLIMNSDAYARSTTHPDPDALAERDPKGVLLARSRPRRLSAEEIRDAMLAASGELVPILGGVPIRPDMNLEAALQPRQLMGTYAPAYQPSPRPQERNRRTLYAMVIRGQRDPFLTVFNQPSPEESCEGRSTSTVPTQALTLFNGAESYDRALATAARILRETDHEDEAVRLAFLLITGGEPGDADLSACVGHWRAMTDRHAEVGIEPALPPTSITRLAIDENTGEPFSFTEELESVRDYVPDLLPGGVDPLTRALADVCLVLFNTNSFLLLE
jgi:mono/diheme cytochrome c family protein